MDALRAEINNKRKALAEESAGAPRPTKYMRRGDIEKLKEEQEAKERRLKADIAKKEEELAQKEAQEKRVEAIAKRAVEIAKKTPAKEDTPEVDVAAIPFNVSNEETVRRLRAKGQPIRLFAEEDKDRRLRLRALELIEERGTGRQGGQNDFKKALEDVENVELALKNKGETTKGKKSSRELQAEATAGSLDLALIKSDPDKLYPIIYYALKKVLKEWGDAMDERPDSIKRTTQGKLAAATQMQSAEYLKPLFKSLRARNLPADVLGRMAEIVHYMQERRYQRANDSYLRLSIGNAPWPIGVTMVGIHERSAREKISSDQVAHVLNDEVSRKYIQSLKRHALPC